LQKITTLAPQSAVKMQSLKNLSSSKTEDWSEHQCLILKLRKSKPTETLQNPVIATEVHGEHPVTVTITEIVPSKEQKSRLGSSFIAPLVNFVESLKERRPKKKEEVPKKERETAKKIIEIEKRRESLRKNKEAARKVAMIEGRNEDDAMMPREDTRELMEGTRRRGEAIRKLKEDIRKME